MSQSIVKFNDCVWKSGKSWSHALLIVSLFHTVSGSDHTAPGGVNDCGFSDIVWLQIGIEHRHHPAFSEQSFKCQLPVMGGHVRPGLKFQSFSFLTFFFFLPANVNFIFCWLDIFRNLWFFLSHVSSPCTWLCLYMDTCGVTLNTPRITMQRPHEQNLHMLSGLYSSCKEGH